MTAVRTQSGVLEVILWQYSDSNLPLQFHGVRAMRNGVQPGWQHNPFTTMQGQGGTSRTAWSGRGPGTFRAGH